MQYIYIYILSAQRRVPEIILYIRIITIEHVRCDVCTPRGHRYRGHRYRGHRYRGYRYRGHRYRGHRYRGTPRDLVNDITARVQCTPMHYIYIYIYIRNQYYLMNV